MPCASAGQPYPQPLSSHWPNPGGRWDLQSEIRWMLIRSMAVALLIALFAGVTVKAEAKDATAAAVFAVHAYVAGEENGFAKMQGDPTGAADDSFVYYSALLDLPGASACAVYAVKSNGDRFATCDFDAATEAEAQTLWDTWRKYIDLAEPGWKTLRVKNPSHIAQVIVEDPQGVRGVYIYVSKKSSGRYELTTTFGTVAAIER